MSTPQVSADVDSNGVMVVHGSNGDESYEITKIPLPTAYLVQNAKKDILHDLSLQNVLTDLNRASDLLYLAYLGVIGTGDLHARVSTRQMELYDLCRQCVVTMTALRDGSSIVLDRLTEAYSYLLKANEKRALRILSRCAAVAHTMATHCEELAQKFEKLKDDTHNDANTASTAMDNEQTKIEQSQKLRKEMEATLKQQENVSRMLKEKIEEMKTDIAKEEVREEAAENHAFLTQIVSVFANAIGGGLGICSASMAPVKINLVQGSSVPAGAKEASGDARPDLEELKIRQDDKANAQKVNEEAKIAETKARDRKREAKAKVLDAERDKEAKQVLLNAAKATNTADAGHEEKVREAQTAFHASSITLSKLLEEKKQAEKDLALAKKSAIDAKAALDAVVAALDNIVSTANKMSQQQADRATTHANNRIEMVKLKRDWEEQRCEAIGQIASLTSRLETNKYEMNVEQSAHTALYIATSALHNIKISFSHAADFWVSMKRFCDQLADPKMLEEINDEIADECTPEERIKFYKSPDFVGLGTTYVCKWTALAIVCDEYVVAFQHARKSVSGYIKACPTAEEARKLIEPLKKQLDDELKKDEVEAKSNIHALNTETEQLKAEIAAINADDEA